jgi:hypothetical protein
MEASAARRVGLAAGVALVAVAAIAFLLSVTDVEAGSSDLVPDLVTLAVQQDDMVVVVEGKRTVLRFTNEIGDRANGPLEIFPSAQSSDCDANGDFANDRDAYQRVFADSNGSGGFERDGDGVGTERLIGCMRFHPAHNHWHVLDIATYELRYEPTGETVLRKRKVGYCLTDARLAFPSPVTSHTSTYPINPPDTTGCQAVTIQGISSGWADAYQLPLPGQELDITGLPRGRYCLTSRTDPTNVLTELDDDNNVRRVHIALRPPKLGVQKLDTPCRI